ncbi:MAG: carboxypeptidase regulatory-like domain-containing protein [Polyangiaceae bacterium]|nr:carboxypeptidase regulatory-like domain-containing protein [Myxococcales bacterium]MCB9586136.1 carboxypeptidase regulatory-like domain-containing protein [Polyangiaceae bacterium]MCB9606814.1 carboxypeptidase regulatory-like domain-containing protein [Polyangiaceae bacterium]
MRLLSRLATPVIPLALLAVSCSSEDVISEPAVASVEGDVLAFLDEVGGERVSGATVSVLEHPEMQVVTGDDAHFRFDGLRVGSDVTLVVEHPNFKTTQTATLQLTEKGIHPFAIQVVSKGIFTALSGLVPTPVNEAENCVVASTVARMGGSLYVHLRQGMADVSVSLSPAPPAGSGPIYFDENVLPAVDQPATSKDGGVLFYNVPPGDYVMSATRANTLFNQVRFHCRAGVIVNAGPPDGLLANVPDPDRGAGGLYPADAYSAVTDTLCETTAQCVNEDAGAIHYPPATVTSCKAMFSDTWAFVDESCDADAALRDAAKALYTCRAQSCDAALGGDDVCVDEDAAFNAAQDVYGACLSGK